MATTSFPTDETSAASSEGRDFLRTGSDFADAILQPLASLKLTVVLLFLSILSVLFGTLAQVDADIWKAVADYFRIDDRLLFVDRFPWLNIRELFTWVPTKIFFPPAWFPDPTWVNEVPSYLRPFAVAIESLRQFSQTRGFWYPRGWSIGIVMMLNLVAAHLVRFKVAAEGRRLMFGWIGLAASATVTWLVIQSGNNSTGVQVNNLVTYEMLWRGSGIVAFALTAACIWGAVSARIRPLFWGLLIASAVFAATSIYLISSDPLSPSSMRILYQLAKGTVAGVAILIPAWMVFDRRAGMVTLHAGIGLMMAYEVYVGMHAAHMESRMQIEEGHVANYSYDIRAAGLAVVDKSNPDHDLHTVIPAWMLYKGATFDNEQLPFRLEMVEFYPNSDVRERLPKDKNEKTLATKGRGLGAIVTERPIGTGVDTDQKADVPSGFVRVIDRKTGKDEGTYLVTALLTRGETITIDGKSYDLALRFRRQYKPYQIELIDVQKNDYVGTTRPKDYRSKIRLVDPRNDVNREFEIWMNNPLRYAGETFYQSSYIPAGAAGDNKEMTDFQVVANEGWMTPYVACMIVVIGMLYHFGLILMRFLNRSVVALDQLPGAHSGFSWRTHGPALGIAALTAVYIAMTMSRTPALDRGFDLNAFGRIPIFDGGRAQPLDSYALNNLMQAAERQSFWDENKKKLSAIRWLLDSIATPDAAAKHAVFRIDNPDIVKELGLDWRESHLYSQEEIGKKWPSLKAQVANADDKQPNDRTIFERKLLSLARKLSQYEKMKASFTDMRSIAGGLPPMPTEEDFEKDSRSAQRDAARLIDIVQNARAELGRMQLPLVIPTHTSVGKEGKESLFDKLQANWEPMPLATVYAHIGTAGGEKIPALDLLTGILAAYRDNKPEDFNAKVKEYLGLMHGMSQEDRTVPGTGTTLSMSKVDFESFYNRAAPFWTAFALYMPAMILVLLGWLLAPAGLFPQFRAAAWWLTLVTFLLHAAALAGRIYISGRPPVTNLYSASVFIGFAIVAMGLILELFSRMGIATFAAAVAGCLTLRVADALRLDGDTLSVLEPVLDTQFWLATHVVCITLGYATSYVAGLLGIGYILGGVLTPSLDSKIRRMLYGMTYGTICFALFFSFFGTVLGGLWADDSWGRFWGWDPKENGALIIVLWNALILHARWGGMARERGVAILSVLGNIVVTWSFFGVNELGVGLHTYGFTEGRLRWIGIFAGAHILIAAIGCLPKSAWLSHKREEPTGGSLPA